MSGKVSFLTFRLRSGCASPLLSENDNKKPSDRRPESGVTPRWLSTGNSQETGVRNPQESGETSRRGGRKRKSCA
ncbi:hypothetical protein PBY51_006440 [Eleginops maclovinus]|uniref:Uncharacterized protein n=1 Tax=Eleginops maclovinus TaxID=56733 RepID=A0AAN7WZX9_ELEMC|nr:hypothetical protein PBY51_006440 [Eleginops maclovinus]